MRDLGHEAALADARVADDRRERGPLFGLDVLPERQEALELCGAPDERRVAHAAARRRVPYAECLPDAHRLRLALRLDRFVLFVLDRVRGRAVGHLAHEDPVDGRRRLDARRRVEDVAPGDPLALLGAVAVGDDHLAGRDADADLDLADRILAVEGSDRVEDQERSADGALGIVLVRDWDAEMRDDRVADVLLDRAAAAFELGAEATVDRARAARGRPPGRATPRGRSTRRGRRTRACRASAPRPGRPGPPGARLHLRAASRIRGRISRAPGSPHRSWGIQPRATSRSRGRISPARGSPRRSWRR